MTILESARLLAAFAWLGWVFAYCVVGCAVGVVVELARIGAGQRAREAEYLLTVGYGIQPLAARSVANA